MLQPSLPTQLSMSPWQLGWRQWSICCASTLPGWSSRESYSCFQLASVPGVIS
jgi:hypothetical protein